jgi:acetophenone carboxylase
MADPEDATDLGVATQAQVITGFHACMEKMKFASPSHDHVTAGWAGTAGTTAVGGVTKEGVPFAAWDQGQPNGSGIGARWDSDGIDVAGFIWCAIGEFLDSESIEHNYPILPIFRSVYWKDAAGYGKYRGGRSMNALYRVHNTPFLAVVAIGGYSARPTAPGLFGGYPSRPMGAAFIRNHNLDELIAKGETPTDIYETVERVKGDWSVVHQNSGIAFLQEGDLYQIVAASGPGYGDVLERDPELVMKDVRESAISHRTAREVFRCVYREDNLVVDEAATQRAREAERRDRIARARPYDEWEAGWLQQRPPDEILGFYGSWPGRMDTPLVDWEPTEELLDPHVREGGAPRERASRY